MYSDQLYKGIYSVDRSIDSTTGELILNLDELKSRVEKYYLYYQIESRINFLRYLYITPVLGINIRLQHRVDKSSNPEFLYRNGMYEINSNR
ncbi:MAG: hypothetical protein ACI9JN_001507 [Bacteroidia bacterium]|jgi:hypothetical protein